MVVDLHSPVSKVWFWFFSFLKTIVTEDFNPDLPCESLDIGKLTHAGGPGSNPGQANLWRLVTLKPLKVQQYTSHFRKPLIFFFLDKRGQQRSCMFSLWYAIMNRASHKNELREDDHLLFVFCRFASQQRPICLFPPNYSINDQFSQLFIIKLSLILPFFMCF